MAERLKDMRITGIICEYDPFHNGHRYLLARAREGSDAVVCVMSGNTTQRGGFAAPFIRSGRCANRRIKGWKKIV